MSRILAVIGAVCFVAAVAIGHFAEVDSAGVIEVAAAAFALCAVVVSAVNSAKERGTFGWRTAATIALAVIGGVLCCIGGLSQSVFAEISGLVLALLSVIFGLLYAKRQEER